VIVVTGASGRVGGAAARLLAEQGHPVRLLVRDPGLAPRLPGAEVAACDYGDPESLVQALHEDDRVFMVSMHREPDERIGLHRLFVEAATRARVAQLVYLSFLSASLQSSFPHARSHRATEELIRASGLPFTFLRTSLYFDGILGELEAGVMRGPGGGGRVSWVASEDCGAVVAGALTGSGHEEKTYDVTGPEALALAETAAVLSEVCGRDFRYEDEPSLDEAVRWRVAAGYSPWIVRVWTGMYEAIKDGELAPVSDVVERVGGRPATSLREFAAARRNDFLAKAAP
jgi:NAD(P)H dehydrogenase (quinone)